MSRIYTEFKCEHCGEVIETYVSFGHPDEDFDHKWECGNCGKENTLHVPAWPWGGKNSGNDNGTDIDSSG